MISAISTREVIPLKILRFNDDRIGVIKNGNMVVDVSDTISARKAKGPQRVMEEIIEGWRKYRRRFEKVLAEQDGVPLDSVQLRSPAGTPRQVSRRLQQLHRPRRTHRGQFPQRIFLQIARSRGPGRKRRIERHSGLRGLPTGSGIFIRHRQDRQRRAGKKGAGLRVRLCADLRYFNPRYGAPDAIYRQGARQSWLLRPVDHHQRRNSRPAQRCREIMEQRRARQNYNTSNMAHKIPNQIAWLTKFVQLSRATSSPPAHFTKG